MAMLNLNTADLIMLRDALDILAPDSPEGHEHKALLSVYLEAKIEETTSNKTAV